MTSTFVLLPDAEALVINALLSLNELDPLGGRIYSVVPKNRVFPLARVSRFGGDPMYEGDPYWLDQPNFQVDVWADGGFVEAVGIAETLRACFVQRIRGRWPAGVISSAKVSALVQTVDLDFDPPKPRYRFTATVVLRPNRGE